MTYPPGTFGQAREAHLSLTAVCDRCDKFVTFDLDSMTDAELRVRYVNNPPKCTQCGSRGSWQVRGRHPTADMAKHGG